MGADVTDEIIWYVADQKAPGYTTNPEYAKKDKDGNLIIPAERYRARQESEQEDI